MPVLNALINQLNSSVAVLLLVLVGVFFLVWKVAKFTSKWDHRDEELSRIRDKWDADIPYIKERINIIFQSYSNSPSAVKSSSPLSLTKTGEEISKEIKAEEIVGKYYLELADKVEKMRPKHAYDYQKYSVEVVEKELVKILEEKYLNKAKDQALKHGVPLDNALAVVAILLRDRLLASKDIHLSDVDKHDPHKETAHQRDI